MIDLCKLIWCAVRWAIPVAGCAGSRNPGASAPTECAPPQVPGPFGLLQHRPAGVCRHVRAGSQHSRRAEDRQTGNRAPLASCRIPGLLALEIATTGRAAEYSSRDSRPHSRDEHCQPALGRTSHPRRIAQARHRCRADHGCEVHGEDQAPTLAGLEDLPRQSCRWHCRRWTCSSCRRFRFGCYTGF